MASPVLGILFERGCLDKVKDLLLLLELHLFTNDHQPTANDDGTEYDEPVAPWYAPAALDAWSSVVLDDDGTPAVYHDPVTFTNTGGPSETIYGYFVTDSDGSFCWAQREAAPPVYLDVGGTPYSVKLRYTLREDPAL